LVIDLRRHAAIAIAYDLFTVAVDLRGQWRAHGNGRMNGFPGDTQIIRARIVIVHGHASIATTSATVA